MICVFKCVLFVFLLWIYVETCTELDEVESKLDPTFYKSVKSLTHGLALFERHVNELNIDSVYSLKVMRDQLELVVKKLNETSLPENSALADCFKKMMDKCEQLVEKATKEFEAEYPDYFKKIGKILDSNWSIDVDSRPVNMSLIQTRIEDGQTFYGNKSDFCFGKLMNSQKCQVPPICWEFNTQLGKSEYAITHQLLYFEIGLVFNCFPKNREITDLMDIFCSNIFNESYVLASDGFPQSHRDLFMEQVYLCGMVGYSDFLNKDWIESILSWQDKSLGCWLRHESSVRPWIPKRVKRNEKMLPDGCLCHMTGMALCAITQFIKEQVKQESFHT